MMICDPQVETVGSVEEILITDRLYSRPPKRKDPQQEQAAFARIAGRGPVRPKAMLDELVNVAVEICEAGSSGLSVLYRCDGEAQLRWDAMAGVYAPHVGGTTPRDFSPCGATLDRNSPQLFYYPGRLFRYFNAVSPPIVEGLVLPVNLEGHALGTLWVVSHDETRHFDSEDVRVMDSLCYFTTVAIASLHARDHAAADGND